MTHRRHYYSALFLALAVVNVAHAELEEITVTAEFRENNIQDTPISITAMTGTMLDDRGITELTQVAATTPGVTLAEPRPGYGNTAAIYIRGVGQQDFSFALEPGVGIYIDDIYYGTAFGSAFDLVDLDRIEILRGPQGTLAGKNSIGGAVKLFSTKPDGTGGGYIEGTYGTDTRLDIRAASDFTIIEDKLFARASYISRKRDGHMDRLDYECVNPGSGYPRLSGRDDCKLGTLGGQDLTGGRLYLRATPTDNLEISVIADVLSDSSEPAAATLVSNVNPDSGLADPVYAPFIVSESDPYHTYSTYQIPAVGFSVPTENTVDSKGISAHIDWAINDNLSFQWITSYRTIEGQFSDDADGSPEGNQLFLNQVETDQFTQELRLNGSNDFMDWTVGAFYYDNDAMSGGQILVGGGFLYFDQFDEIEATSKSAFAHTVFHMNEKLDLTLGLRYTKDEKSYEFIRTPVLGPSPFIVNGVSNNYDGKETDFRVALNYQITDDIMVFGQVSTGFKGGGIGPRPFLPSQVQGFDTETLTAYELGLKSVLLDNTLRLNASVFFNDYKDIQLDLRSCPQFTPVLPFAPDDPNDGVPVTATTGGTGLCSLPQNAGDADVKGIELEAEYYPVDGLSIDLALGYLDFEYTKVNVAVGVPEGAIAPYTPEWKVGLGIQYEMNMPSSATLTPRLDVAYQSETFRDVANKEELKLDSKTILNASLRWKSSNEEWEGILSVTNLTDKVYFHNLNSLNFGIQGVVARPREFAITLKRNF